MHVDSQEQRISRAAARRARTQLLVLLCGAIAVLVLAGPSVWDDAFRRGATSSDLVAALAVALAWLTALRIVLACAALAVGRTLEVIVGSGNAATRAAHTIAKLCSPAACRGLLRLAIGATVVVGPLAGPAAFAAGPPPGAVGRPVMAVAPLPDLDRLAAAPVARTAPIASTTPTRAPAPVAPEPPAGHVTVVPLLPASGGNRVVVRPGDSLWHIAARDLPPGHSEADVARAWPRWYAANRATIGPDPREIKPGQILVRPSA